MKLIKILAIGSIVFAIAGNNNAVIAMGGELLCQALAVLLLSMATLKGIQLCGLPPILRSSWHFLPVVVYFGYVFAAQLLIPSGGPKGIGSMAQYLLVSIVAVWLFPTVLLTNQELRNWLLKTLLMVSVFLAATGIMGAIAPPGLFGELFSKKASYHIGGGFHASGGILEHMITLSVQLMLGIFIWKWAYGRARGARNFHLGLLVIVLGLGLLLSMGRSGWVGVAFGLLVASTAGRSAGTTVAGVLGMTAVTAIGYYALYYIAGEVDWLGELLRLDYGLSNREYLWTVTVDLIKQRPLGWGFRAPQTELAYLFSGELSLRRGIGGAGNHNTFLDICLSYGVPAVILYYIIFAAALINVIRSNMDLPLRRLLIASVLGVLVSSHFITFNLGGARYTTLCINILLGMALLSPALGRYGPVRAEKKGEVAT